MTRDIVTSVDVIYDGSFGSEVRADLLKEFVKYVLYQRSQIPMYFDQIKESIRQQNDDASVTSQARSARTAINDQAKFVQSIDVLFKSINNIFTSGETIKQVAILLGSSIFSPKDSYLFNFPTEFYEGKILSRQACVSQLFRTLYTQDFLGSSKPLNSCTNLFVMLLAPRGCDHQRLNLLPRLSYKLPQIGTHYAVNVVFEGASVKQANSELNLVGDELNISGIQPLEKSELDCLVTLSFSPDSCSTAQSGVVNSHDCEENDFIWFEIPVVVKGYRDKF